MEFRIADTFTDSLARLTGEEQKAVKITAFDLQMNPAHPSMQLHKLDKARDPHFLQENAPAGAAACRALVDFCSRPFAVGVTRLPHLRRDIQATGRAACRPHTHAFRLCRG